MQGSGEAGLRKAAVEILGLLHGIRVEENDGVNGGTVLVIGLDALQVFAYEGAAGEAAALHGVVDLGDGGFFNFERRGRLGQQRRGAQKGCEEEIKGSARHWIRIARNAVPQSPE